MARRKVKIAKKLGLPVIHCKHHADKADELTPERVAAILLAQEAAWHTQLNVHPSNRRSSDRKRKPSR